MKRSLIALAFGTLALGIAEFVMMGILPDVAKAMNISIEKAGHFISAYALGVCAGAPALIMARKYQLKNILLVLVGIIIIGNLCAAASSSYWMLLVSRFISGLPHGAYFGVASIVAEKLADKGKGTQAVSIMIAGMTIANLFGVPLGTSLSTMISWRTTFLIVGFWGLATILYIWKWVPHVEKLEDTGFKGQFQIFQRRATWLILGATALGNGGVFCWYSYINPLLTKVAGFSPESITGLMMLAGFGMVVGNLIGGRLSDRFSPGRVGAVVQGMIAITLLAIFFSAQIPWLAVLLMTVCTAGLFAVSSPEQISIISVARGGEMLGAACVQIAFNLGNALGAYAGGKMLCFGYQYPALLGVPMALAGFIMLTVYFKKYEPKY